MLAARCSTGPKQLRSYLIRPLAALVPLSRCVHRITAHLFQRDTTNASCTRPGRGRVPEAAGARPIQATTAAIPAPIGWWAARGRTSRRPRAPQLQHLITGPLRRGMVRRRPRRRSSILGRASAVYFCRECRTTTNASDTPTTIPLPRRASAGPANPSRQIKRRHARAHVHARACADVP